ncbi:urease accessory protein UreH domain-containing protein [Sphaerisporangium corydalis]|uniref:Sulfite exporter TauE/SafE family protein n=1 Tax=Sphaerisporangium corydalis TaxID=1441875 RepID=A0ABV9EQI4_9ACTN|nr:sulfite exporter TauE/SafE family protein [Sphaerisporangium corydalis]
MTLTDAPGSHSLPSSPSLPRHRGRLVVLSVIAGAVAAALWSFRFVDSVIGDNVANTLLGYDAKGTAISGVVAGAVFAFVSGLAGTFTACNVAAFGAVVPLVREGDSWRDRLRETVRPLSRLAIGMIVVSGVYGAVGALFGDRLPQLSTATVGDGLPVRLIQASVVFGIIGLAFIWLGLASIRLLPDPLARLERRFPNARLVVLGALVGGFLIGRPFPLFHKLFSYAAETHNPLYGAAVFILQSLGNIVVMAVLFAALMLVARGRFARWMTAKPSRMVTVTAVAFIVAGTFTFLYWDVRLPAMFGYGWYPTASW